MANKAGTVWVDVRGDTSGFLRDVSDGARKATSGLAGIVGNGVSTVMGDIATSAGVAAVGLGVVGAAAVKTSADFNASMSGVSAVAGATAEQMEMLREAALKAGADTAFSASEAATAQAELAKAGVSVADILGGALAGSLGLAAAGQLELGNAAEISAQALNIFNLEGSETTRVADVLAAGANKSAADVAQLGDALRQGGLVAKQTGLDLEDTVGVLSLFADNALIGSDAGTSLKTMLQRLVPQSDEAAESMKQLGLNFFDANGAFVGIEAVAQQLQDSLGGLSAEQKSAALNTLFGADAIRAASLLMDAGAAGVREYTTAVSDQGAAARMAAEQLDNLKGDLEEFSGATETALIRVGDLFDGLNRSVVQSATGLVNVFNDFATTPAWKRIQANFDSLASAGGQRIDQLSARLTGLLGDISPADVDRAFSAIDSALAKIADSAEGLGPVIAGVGVSLASLGGAAVLGPLGGIVPTISPISGALAGLVLGSSAGRDALRQLGERAGEFATGTVPEVLKALSGLADELSGAVADALSGLGGAAFDAAETLGPVLADAINELGPVIGDLITSTSELAEQVLPVLADIAGDVLPVAVDVLAVGLGVAADAVGLLADNAWLLVPALGAVAAVNLSGTVGAWGTAIASTAQQFGRSVSDFGTYFGVLRAEGNNIVGSLRGAGEATGGLASSLTGALNPAVLGVTAAVSVGVGVYQAWSSAKRRAEEVTRNLADALIEETDLIGVTYDALRANVADLGVERAAAKAGISLRQVSEEIRESTGEFDKFREIINNTGSDQFLDFGNTFTDNWSQITAAAQQAGVEVPDSVQQIQRAVAQGLITEDQGLELLNAFVDADKASQLAADNIVGRFADIKDAAEDLNIDITPFITRFEDAQTFEEQKAVIDELKAKYPELADAIGLIEGASNQAASAVQGLRDQLDALSGAQVDAQRATRDYAAAIDRLADSFVKADGTKNIGIDFNTPEGRANADAIDAAVEQAQKLAEAQALVDRTGQLSKATLLDITNQLGALYEQGLLTSDEYASLIELYGLTPEQIDTKVTLAIEDAQAKVGELQAAFDEVKGQLEEPVRSEIQALIDEGKYEEALGRLSRLGVLRTTTYQAELDEQSRAAVEAKLNDLPGVTEGEKAKFLAELDAGNIAGVNALLDELAAARRVDFVINPALPKDSLLQQMPLFNPGASRDGRTGVMGREQAVRQRAAGTPTEIQTQAGLALSQGRVTDAENLLKAWEDDLRDGNISNPLFAAWGLSGRRERGGPIWPGGWLVGEDGPEVVQIGATGTVFSNDESRQRVTEAFGLPIGTDGASITGAMNDPTLLAELQRQSELTVALQKSVEQLGAAIAAAGGGGSSGPLVNIEHLEAPTELALGQELANAALRAKALVA